MIYENDNRAVTPSREGGKKDEKAGLQICIIAKTHSLYNKLHTQSEQPEVEAGARRPVYQFDLSSYLRFTIRQAHALD
jgi:hypothetical protein